MKRSSLYTFIFLGLVLLSTGLSAQKPVTITLLINYSSDLRIFHDEPLLFTVSITNNDAREDSRWNRAADRRLNELEELLRTNRIGRDDYEKEKKKLTDGRKGISSITIGSSRKPWTTLVTWKAVNIKSGDEMVLPVKILPNPSTENTAVLDEKGFYQAFFGIDPGDVKNIPVGEYAITVLIEGENSEPVHMQIRQENMPFTTAKSEEVLLRTGQYYWHSGDSKNAMLFAEMILDKDPVSIDGLSLKADAKVMVGSYQPALETYEKALKEFYKQNPGTSEPPQYLLEMIRWVKTQL